MAITSFSKPDSVIIFSPGIINGAGLSPSMVPFSPRSLSSAVLPPVYWLPQCRCGAQSVSIDNVGQSRKRIRIICVKIQRQRNGNSGPHPFPQHADQKRVSASDEFHLQGSMGRKKIPLTDPSRGSFSRISPAILRKSSSFSIPPARHWHRVPGITS